MRLDDADLGKLLEQKIREVIDPDHQWRNGWTELADIFQVPIAVGVEIRNPLVFAGVLTVFRQKVMDAIGNSLTWEPMKEPYKGVSIVRIKPNAQDGLNLDREFGNPALYYVTLDRAFYLATKVEPIRDLIDKHLARKGNASGGAVVEVNQSVHISPAAAKKAKEFVHGWLEWETHRRALDAARVLHPLHRGKLIGPDDPAASADAKIFQLLGFVPVSPDNEPYTYDVKNDEVVNRRHGSSRMPDLRPAIAEASPLAKMLEQFASIRADLRFREDGIHTIVTLKRGK